MYSFLHALTSCRIIGHWTQCRLTNVLSLSYSQSRAKSLIWSFSFMQSSWGSSINFDQFFSYWFTDDIYFIEYIEMYFKTFLVISFASCQAEWRIAERLYTSSFRNSITFSAFIVTADQVWEVSIDHWNKIVKYYCVVAYVTTDLNWTVYFKKIYNGKDYYLRFITGKDNLLWELYNYILKKLEIYSTHRTF